MPDRRRLSAAEGVRAARILFALNTETSAILRMLRQCGFPPALLQDGHAAVLCTEWRAFVHAAVTAALMQHAPVEVVLAYLRQTHQLLGDAAPAALRAEATMPGEPVPAGSMTAEALSRFVDGPFSAYMPLLAQAGPQACPALFHARSGAELPQPEALAVQARLAAVMALLISTLNDKLDAYDILAE
ncbi:serine/threonine protein kinase [uncultured Desulfovibrio sp.]|uniref:serine/threonine protein kinase n=1 Tax=uncultured Desulfovibrio sp. TaxID=167968 RepID=UPI0025EDE7FE|nr:serine/threonine protein kinase [uncultured Desulfovibrio sp.]